jgi:hypothetical protein
MLEKEEEAEKTKDEDLRNRLLGYPAPDQQVQL